MASWPLLGMFDHVGGGGGYVAMGLPCSVMEALGVEAPEGRVRGGDSGGWSRGVKLCFCALPSSMAAGDQLPLLPPLLRAGETDSEWYRTSSSA